MPVEKSSISPALFFPLIIYVGHLPGFPADQGTKLKTLIRLFWVFTT